MKVMISLSFLTLWAISCVSQDQIKQTEVSRIIKTLSSDEMEGRATFTSGIEKASQFIQNEFKNSDLKYFEGLSSFEQKFNLYIIKPSQSDLSINGKKVSNDNYFTASGTKSFSWNQNNPVEKIYVNENGSVRDAYSKAKKKNADALILVNTQLIKQFNRFRNFIGTGTRRLNLNESKSMVFVLADSVPVNSFQINVKNEVSTQSLSNVVGVIPGKKSNEFVVFSGHYDHLGFMTPVEGDSIANGADDDASGSTAVMSLANYFSKQGQPERTLIFVCFTAEEVGGYGSQYFSKQLNPDQVVAMFNIEMIGKPSKFGPNSAFITGFDKSDFGTILQNAVQGSAYSFHPDPYPEQKLFYRSDNETLARLGVPAHSISSDQIDKDELYHSVNDKFESLDIPSMTNMIRAIAVGAKSIVDGKATPTRIKKEDLD